MIRDEYFSDKEKGGQQIGEFELDGQYQIVLVTSQNGSKLQLCICRRLCFLVATEGLKTQS